MERCTLLSFNKRAALKRQKNERTGNGDKPLIIIKFKSIQLL